MPLGKALFFFVFVSPTAWCVDDWSSEYLELLEAYYAPGSRALECMRKRDKEYAVNTSYLVVGLEGAGHHMFFSMDVELSGLDGRSYDSFPKGLKWRQSEKSEKGKNASNLLFPDFSKYDKFLVVSRDPIDAHFSAIRRFWGRHRNSLASEQEALLLSLAVIQEGLQRIDCNKLLYMPYEVVTRQSEHINKAIAAFLGVHPDNPKLVEWVEGIKHYESTNWPSAVSRSCDDEKIGSRFYSSTHRGGRDSVWANGNDWIKREKMPTQGNETLEKTTAKNRLAAEYYERTRRWFYEEYLPTHKKLYDVVPGHPMSFCAVHEESLH